MKGTVIHSSGHFRRFLKGKHNGGQVSVKVMRPEPPSDGGTVRAGAELRPAYYTFYCDGKLFAGSHKVVLTKGRRYPNVEHWFISPD